LPEIHRAPVEVAADEVAVVRFQLSGPHGVPPQNPVAEAGSEALDLRLDPFGHVLG
jgi:hypothetical protein